MCLPLPEIVSYSYISWGMSNNSTFFKTIEFKRRLNSANENIGFLGIVLYKKEQFQICCFII